jgi:hypothetical protein
MRLRHYAKVEKSEASEPGRLGETGDLFAIVAALSIFSSRVFENRVHLSI